MKMCYSNNAFYHMKTIKIQFFHTLILEQTALEYLKRRSNRNLLPFPTDILDCKDEIS